MKAYAYQHTILLTTGIGSDMAHELSWPDLLEETLFASYKERYFLPIVPEQVVLEATGHLTTTRNCVPEKEDNTKEADWKTSSQSHHLSPEKKIPEARVYL